MKTYNMPHRILKRRETVLAYWKRQLNKETRSVKCKSDDAAIRTQIENLEKKIKAGG